MCGIVGYWARDGAAAALAAALPAATDALRHRGPDGEGLWRNAQGVGFGHRRLSVIDLSHAGAQPMVARDAEIVIVLNGEIYNYAEVAAELAARGHAFSGHSDTEVVLAAYREWDTGCVDRFIGMFAFAIWDGPRRRLSLCRDRVGVKPLYYGWDGQTLMFASELKALRAFPHWTPDIDAAALGEYLQYGYIAAPRTIYRAARKLAPGAWLHLHAEGEPTVRRYWSLRNAVEKGPINAEPAVLEEELEALLVDACRYRMVADVPVGLFLSGGVDSSLVAGLLKSSGVDLETFTIGFDSGPHNEAPAAAKVAAALGLRNEVLTVGADEAQGVLQRWSALYDEPFGDHAGIPTYLLSSMTRKRVTVALSADGGDEEFCGYAGYAEFAQRMAAQARVPRAARALGAGALAVAETLGPFDLGGTMAAGVNRAIGAGLACDRIGKMRTYLGAETALDAVRPFHNTWQTSELRRLLGPSYQDPRAHSLKWKGEPLEQIAALDFHEYLPDDVLAKTDRATMAAGLEGREPLLDHRVVEMAYRLPLAMRHGQLGPKHALRSILYRHVPRELVDRPKHGFDVPLRSWMVQFIANGAVRDSLQILVEKLGLDGRQLAGGLKTFAGSDQGRNRLWLLYTLGLWAERWA